MAHTTDTWPPNCIIQRSLQHAKLRPLTASKGQLLTKEERHTSWQTGPVARSQPTAMDAIASAIRLLTDNGYVVLKAPTWPEHLPVEATRPPPVPVKAPALTFGSHVQDVLSDVREFMSVKQFCSLFSIGRSTAYAHMKSGRLKVQKVSIAMEGGYAPPASLRSFCHKVEPAIYHRQAPRQCTTIAPVLIAFTA